MPTTLAAFVALNMAALTGAFPADTGGDLTTLACIRCHSAQAQEWFESPHRTAFTEETFQTAVAIEPAPFCRRCHGPEADPTLAEITPPARLGVGCVACHVQEDQVLSWKADGPPAPHAVLRQPRQQASEICAPCHEFTFPDSRLRDKPLFMQRTVSEHAQSRFSDTTCIECHMSAESSGGSSHEFLASRSPAMVTDGARVDAERTGPADVRITLRAGKIGHAFPTGDLFRRVEVGVQVVLGDGEGPSRTRYLTRHFGRQVQSSGIVLRGELRDDRVPANGDPREVTWTIPEAEGRPIRWWVDYQRVGHHTTPDPRSAKLDGALRVAEGTLPPT